MGDMNIANSNNNRKKKILYRVFILIIVAAGIFLINPIYGLFNPPVTLLPTEGNNFDKYDIVFIRYFDVHDDVMLLEEITDKDQVDKIYQLVCETKVKNKLFNIKSIINMPSESKMAEKGRCALIFTNQDGEVLSVNYVQQKYVLDDAYYHFAERASEIASEELFDYLNQFAEKYDPEVVGQGL